MTAPIRAEQVDAIGRDEHVNAFTDSRQVFVRDGRHQAIRADVQVYMARSAKPLHEHHVAGEPRTGERATIWRASDKLKILGTNAEGDRRRGAPGCGALHAGQAS